MSLFGNTSSGGAGSSGTTPFPSLNLNTGADPNAKRKSIFEPSSTTSNLFGSNASNTTPSLFSSTATTTQSGANLTVPSFSFGKPPALNISSTSNAAPSGGLFGNATTAAAPAGGLFGTATTSTAPAGGLFGSAPTSTAQSGGLFGSAPTATTSSGGLFGSAPTTAKPAPSGLFGNLSGSTTLVPSTTNNSLLGSVQNQNTSQFAAGNSIFGVSGQNNGAAAVQTAQEELGKTNREPAYFNSLLERQKKKARLSSTGQDGRINQLPSVSMDLEDLARRAQELGGQGSRSGNAATDGRAHYLLAASGVSPGKAYRDFRALDSDGVGLDRQSRSLLADERDAYLANLQNKGREAMMKENMESVYREVDTFIERSLGINFDEQRQRIMQHFGLIPHDENGQSSLRSTQRNQQTATRSVFGRSAAEKSMIGTPGSASASLSFGRDNNTSSPGLIKSQTLRDLRDKERQYIERVQELNQARLQDQSYPVMQKFEEVERPSNSDSPRQLVDAYIALQEITGEKNSGSRDKERSFAKDYLDESPQSTGSVKFKRHVLEKSRVHLEKAFFRELETLVEKNPREAQLGGRPSIINKVRAYIRVRAARHDLVPDGNELQQIGENGDYCWILIFYLLRSGFIKEAAEYVNNDAAFQSTDRRFVSYMTAYASTSDRKLSRKLQEMVDGEYQQRAKIAPKGTVDPYRLACYKIIGRCDLAARHLDAVGQGVEDWLWLQFALAREVDRQEELAGEIFGLEQICDTVLEIGQKHFQKGQIDGSNAYGTFFLMQILAGLFEQAIDYLYSFNPVSSVHFAIALNYYGLLRVADYNVAGTELLTFSTTQQPQINFVPLVAHYTASFRTALTVAAVDYLTLICLSSDVKPAALGQMQTNACHECLRELCLETREFAALLGDLRSDGSRIPGAIEQRAQLILLQSREDFLKSITNQAAAVADQRGQISDAVLLYHLCEDYDSVIAILIRAMADAICADLGESPIGLQPLKPRQTNSEPSQPSQDGSQSSLSLTQSTSTPLELAQNMMGLYNSNAAYYGKISAQNREVSTALFDMLKVRVKLDTSSPSYMTILEDLNQIGALPLGARGNISAVRQSAQVFNALPQTLARCVGGTIIWAVRAIGAERENLAKHGSWDTGSSKDSDPVREQLNTMAKDLMVFSGLVKYKLPSRVYDMLTRAGGDVGGY